MPDLPAPLRIRAFRAWWAALQLSNAGTWMQQVAAGYLAFAATHSATWLGVVAFAQRGPSLVLTPFGGRLADRYDRRQLLAATFAIQLAAASGLAIAAATGRASGGVLVALSLFGGCGQAIQYPSQLATISSLVPGELLHSAVALNSAGFNVARILGPAIAGGLLAVRGGATLCFVLNAGSFVVPLVALRRLPASSAGSLTSDASVLAGIVVMWRTPALRRLVLGCAAFTFGAAPLTTLAPAYANALGGGPGWLGVLLGSFGAGAALGSGPVVRIARRYGRSIVIPGAMVAFAVSSAAAALAPNPWAAAALCALSGVSWLAVFSSTNASVQLISSDAIRGRMLALYLWALIGPMAISAPAVGWIAGRIGIREALVACSASVAVAGVFGLARRVDAIDAGALAD